VHAFTWRPVPNEELVIASGCSKDKPHPRCGLVVGRIVDTGQDAGTGSGVAAASTVAHVDTGFEASEIAEVGDARHMRLKGTDSKGGYLRDFTYSYGRVEMGPITR
jgi:hypothetical protein